MYSKMLKLVFPKTHAQEPVVCNLARLFDLEFSILNATIHPRKVGEMVLQLSGSPQSFEKGMSYLKERGITVIKAGEQMLREEDTCVHCGACTAICPTGALSIMRPEMRVIFDVEKCSICKLCVPVCPHHAMSLLPLENNGEPAFGA
jgi:ferredoxin